MSSPEQRFEVPPEYAEVYERAYRRAYDEGQGQLASGFPVALERRGPAPRRSTGRGKRIAIPQQRSAPPTSHRAGARKARRVTPPPASRVDLQRAQVGSPPVRVPQPRSAAPAAAIHPIEDRAADVPQGHRGRPRAGSTWIPVVVLVGVMLLFLVGAFLLGRASVDTEGPTGAVEPGTGPGASGSTMIV